MSVYLSGHHAGQPASMALVSLLVSRWERALSRLMLQLFDVTTSATEFAFEFATRPRDITKL